jgi:ribosomal protein S17E
VIIAILLISAVGIIVYTQREAFGINLSANQAEIRPITSEIDNCLKSTAEQGIYLIGIQGGYIEPITKSFETNFSTVSYAYSDGKVFFPSKENIENQIAGYIDLMLPRCVDFSKWPDFSVSQASVNSKVSIRENEIVINANWPITLQKGTTFRLEKFSLKLPVRLGIIYNSASQIVNSTNENPSRIDLSNLIDIHTNYGLITDMVPYNQTIIYSLTDPKSIIADKPYTFFVAVNL